MAAALSFAQHYVECENCEENPAKFLCKTCPGHLCESCKSEHARRKITQKHEIIHLTSDTGDTMGLLHCSEHKNERLKCYCSPCRTPICTQCIMGRHNGHNVENLTTVYKDVKDQLHKEKDEIDKTLLPKYEELLAKENEKEAKISKRTDEVQRQMVNHTQTIIKMLTAIHEKRVLGLLQEKNKALKSVENSKTEIKRRIKELQETKTQISNNLSEKPGIIYFKATNSNSLNEMRRYPGSIEYKLDNFSPGDIERILQRIDFGSVPSFSMARIKAAALETKAPLKKGKQYQISSYQFGRPYHQYASNKWMHEDSEDDD